MIDNYKNKLKSTLSEKRYKHSLGVCDEAVKLAEKYGADTEKAYTAGILHDCAKGYDTDEQIKLCQKYGVADMIEPMRDFDGVEELRKAAYENIDRAFILGLKQSIVFNAQKNKIIHPNTLSAWNYMLMNGK